MFYIPKFTIRLVAAACFFGLVGCAGEFIEEGYAVPGSREDEILREERTGDDENLGPNAPGYLGPGGEYQIYQDMDPH